MSTTVNAIKGKGLLLLSIDRSDRSVGPNRRPLTNMRKSVAAVTTTEDEEEEERSSQSERCHGKEPELAEEAEEAEGGRWARSPSRWRSQTTATVMSTAAVAE